MNKTQEDCLDASTRERFLSLDQPPKIQEYLDGIPYSAEDSNRCPLSVLRDKKAHCLDGALFAAAALRRAGYPPLIVDLMPVPGKDDDHILAIFHKNSGWGAIAKSNYVGLRYREPVYRNLRELVMSYFDVYFNIYGEKTLRAYTRPVNLTRFDRLDWEFTDAGTDAVEKSLYHLKPIALLTPEMENELAPMDRRSFDAHTMGSDPLGLYRPKR
jgi:hypothetical protein